MTAANCRGAELKILTDDSPPVSFPKGDQAQGWAVDVVREIQRRTGSASRIRMVPWARAFYIAQHEANVAIFATMRTPTREPLFQWVGPLQNLQLGFFAAAGNPITLRSFDDARRVGRIGVTQLFAADQELTRLGFANLDRSTTPIQMLKKLLSGRTDLIASDNGFMSEPVFRANGLDFSAVRQVLPFSRLSTYIAFSKETPADIVRSWQSALDAMVADGTFARLTAHRAE